MSGSMMMEKSFSKMKRTLTVSSNSNQHSVKKNSENNDSYDEFDHLQINNKSLANTSPSIPELVCENDTLREQIERIKKEKEILLAERRSPDMNADREFTFRNSLPSSQKQIKMFRSYGDKGEKLANRLSWENEENEEECAAVIARYKSKIEQQQKIIEELHQNVYFLNQQLQQSQNQIEELIEEQKIKIAELNFANNLKSQSLQTQQNFVSCLEKDLNNCREVIDKQMIKLKENEKQIFSLKMQQKQNALRLDSVERKDELLQNHEEELNGYREKLNDYISVKDDNYRLRNKVAELSVTNAVLHENYYRFTVSISHLWKIKQIQYESLNDCLKQLHSEPGEKKQQ